MLKKSSFEMFHMTVQQSGIHIVQPSTSPITRLNVIA
jgi:hypothetical protein